MEYSLFSCDGFQIDFLDGQISIVSKKLEVSTLSCEVEVSFEDISKRVLVLIDVTDAELAFSELSYDFEMYDVVAVGSVISNAIRATTVGGDTINYSFDDNCTMFAIDSLTAEITVAETPT